MAKTKKKQLMLRKRDGRLQEYDKKKLMEAVQQSFHVARTGNGYASEQVVKHVEERLKKMPNNVIPGTEDIMHYVHEELMEKGLVDVANAYLFYFQSTSKRERIKEFFGVRDDLHFGMNAMWILTDRYLRRNKKGVVKESPSQFFRRIAKVIAKVEKQHKKSKKEIELTEEWFYDIMANKAFFPHDQILRNAGNSKGQLVCNGGIVRKKCGLEQAQGKIVSIEDLAAESHLSPSCSVTTTKRFMRSLQKGEKKAKDLLGAIIEQMGIGDTVTIVFHDQKSAEHSVQELCSAGAINLTAFLKGVPTKGSIDWGLLRQVIQGAVHFLDNVIDASTYPNAVIKKEMQSHRRIGLEIMGFAEFLVHMGIPYHSIAAIKEATRLAKFVQEEAVRSSEQLARERGVFEAFKGSSWDKKKKKVRNATLTAVVPREDLALFARCSSGIEPLYSVSALKTSISGAQLFEVSSYFEQTARHFGFWDSHVVHRVSMSGSVQGVEQVPKRIQKLFKTTEKIPLNQQVIIQAAFQRIMDGVVEKRLIIPVHMKKKALIDLVLFAWEEKVKSLTVHKQ